MANSANRLGVLAAITFVITMVAGGARAQSADEDIRWIERHGFDATLFMERCRSVDDFGREVTGEPLPVGGGFRIECTSFSPTGWWAQQMQGRDGTLYCVLGQLSNMRADGDPHLSIRIVDDGEHGPAQLEATSASPGNLYTVTAFGVAHVWPVWLLAHFDTADIVRDPRDGRACSQLFTVN